MAKFEKGNWKAENISELRKTLKQSNRWKQMYMR